MSFQVLDAGTLRTITGGQVKVAGVMRPLRFIKAMQGGALQTVAAFIAPLTVSATGVKGTGPGTPGATVTTDSTTAVVSGGLAPFTYAWSLIVNGEGGASQATAPTSASTAFTKSGVPTSWISEDTWRVTVTDSLGSPATADITVGFENFLGGTQ